MRDLLVRSRLFNYLAAATPGLKEMVTIGKVWELAQPDRRVKKGREYDLVIVDAPATGHGIGFLQTPRTFAGIARVGPIHNQAQALDAFITQHETTGVAIVSLPEEMPVNESAALERSLTEDVGVAVDQVYMNAMYPERFSERGGREARAGAGDHRGPAAGGGARGRLRAPPGALPARAAPAAGAQRQRAGQDPALHLQAAPGRARL